MKQVSNLVPKGFLEFVAAIDFNIFANIAPNDGRVMVKMFNDKPEEATSKGGIVLTGTKKDKQDIGVVVAAGKGNYNAFKGHHVPCAYAVGDVVMMSGHFGNEIVVGDVGGKLLALQTSDIFCLLTLD
jgi:chaperonin GroES